MSSTGMTISGDVMERRKKAVQANDPAERYETVRHYMAALLEEGTYSAKELSQIVKIPEKDVCDHLEHLQRTLHKGDRRLEVVCASCRHCGFVFTKRDRLTKPGKCPSCRSIHIQAPLFHIERQ